MTGRNFEAGHTIAPDHMPNRAQDSACIQEGAHTRPVSLPIPSPREQIVGVGDLVVWNAREGVGKPCVWIPYRLNRWNACALR